MNLINVKCICVYHVCLWACYVVYVLSLTILLVRLVVDTGEVINNYAYCG